jgi:hypothetical protein
VYGDLGDGADTIALLQVRLASHPRRDQNATANDDNGNGNFSLGRLLQHGCGNCSSYPNVIQLRNQTPEGFLSSLTNIDTFVSIATTLCAKLVMPRPCETLAHRSVGRMSQKIDWDHFIDVKLADKSSAFMQESGFLSSLTRRSCNINVSSTFPNATAEASRDKDCTVHIPGALDFATGFRAAQWANNESRPFIWRVESNWEILPDKDGAWTPFGFGRRKHGDIVNFFLQHARACKDHTMQPSRRVEKVLEMTNEALESQPQKYVTLQVARRSKVCNTSVENVVSYVNCSLGKEAKKQEPILVFTDNLVEEDEEYLSKLQLALSRSLGSKVLRPMSVIADVISQDHGEGMMAFIQEVSTLIKMSARYKLKMDETHCNSCDKVLLKPFCRDQCHGKFKHADCKPEASPQRCSFADYILQEEYQKELFSKNAPTKLVNVPACSQDWHQLT